MIWAGEEKPCFLMQANRPNVSKYAALTCSMWSAPMGEPAGKVDVTEGVCIKQGFLVS